MIEQIIGGCIAVIVAGMPAMVALLKIRDLHLAVNSRMDAFITATKLESEDRFRDLKEELIHAKYRNEQLFEQISEMAKSLIKSKTGPDPKVEPPCP